MCAWCCRRFPAVRSTRCTERGWPTLTVDLLSVDERRELIPKYLKQYGKDLSPARTERLAMAAQTANPLYLRTLLEELRQWGDHNTLDGRIDHYLAAATPRELFDKVLERWEQDFERDRPIWCEMRWCDCGRRGVVCPRSSCSKCLATGASLCRARTGRRFFRGRCVLGEPFRAAWLRARLPSASRGRAVPCDARGAASSARWHWPTTSPREPWGPARSTSCPGSLPAQKNGNAWLTCWRSRSSSWLRGKRISSR